MSKDKKSRILIVDDERQNRTVLSDLLKGKNQVVLAKDGKQALARIEADSDVDLVVLDIRMPDMDGYEVLKRLKANEATQDIPIIFITALNSSDEEAYGLNLGAADYIGKPFHPVIVQARVETQLRVVKQRRQLQEQSEALAESEAKFRQLFEDSADAFLLIEGNRFVECNRAAFEMLGMKSQDTLLNTHPSEISPPTQPDGLSSSEKAEQMIAIAIKRGSHRFEWIHRKEDGTDFPVEVLLTPIFQRGRHLIHVVWRDITERKEAEDAIRLSNEELEQFAYVTSHDLQEPLRAVTSYLQLLEKRFGDRLESEGREYISFAVNGAKQMSHLIRDLLIYSRVGTRSLEPVAVDVGEILEIVRANLRASIEETGALVEVAPMPVILADDDQLIRLFQNLVGNAIKYAAPSRKPEIRIDAEKTGGIWMFRVQDNGIGIEPQYAGKIFIIFQRLHTQSDFEGTGIGLAICKKIVERHGGSIWFESEPGQGSTFAFTLKEPDGSR